MSNNPPRANTFYLTRERHHELFCSTTKRLLKFSWSKVTHAFVDSHVLTMSSSTWVDEVGEVRSRSRVRDRDDRDARDREDDELRREPTTRNTKHMHEHVSYSWQAATVRAYVKNVVDRNAGNARIWSCIWMLRPDTTDSQGAITEIRCTNSPTAQHQTTKNTSADERVSCMNDWKAHCESTKQWQVGHEFSIKKCSWEWKLARG